MAVYENHDIAKKLRSAPGQFDDARLRKDAADEIERLRAILQENLDDRHDKQKARAKAAAYLLLVMGVSLVLSTTVSFYLFGPGFLPGDGFLLVFSPIEVVFALVLNYFMADSLFRD